MVPAPGTLAQDFVALCHGTYNVYNKYVYTQKV